MRAPLPVAIPPSHRPCRSPSTLPRAALAALALPLAAAGCGAPGPGIVEVRIYGEDFIERGIPASEFSDGWTVTFDSFAVAVAEVSLAAGHGEPALRASGQQVFELARPTMGSGARVASQMVPGGHYDHLTFQIEAVRVSGRASRAGTTIRFAWEFPGRIDHACHMDLNVDGVFTRTEITIHGDHLFQDDLTAAEPDLAFDLIAASDRNADGEVTAAELAGQDIRTQARYQVGNVAATHLWAFIAHQATTLGHVDGEGHCQIRRD